LRVLQKITITNSDNTTVSISGEFSPMRIIRDNIVYARYLYIKADDTQKFSQLQLKNINVNTLNGAPFAIYELMIDDDTLANKTITELGFSSDGRTVLTSLQDLSIRDCSSGSVLEIHLSLDMDFETQGISLMPLDDNRVVRTLLGNDFIVQSLAWFNSSPEVIHGSVPYGPAMENNYNVSTNMATWTNEGMVLRPVVQATQNDAAFTIQGSPTMRIALQDVAKQDLVISGTVSDELVMPLNIFSCFRANNFAQSGSQLDQNFTQVLETPAGFFPAPNTLMQHFAPELDFITDPSNRTAAFVSDTDVYLVAIKRQRPQVVARINRQGALAFLPFRNELALLYPNELRLYRFSEIDGLALQRVVTLTRTGDNQKAVVVRRGQEYLLSRSVNNGLQLERINISPTGPIVQDVLEASGHEILFRNHYQVGIIMPIDASVSTTHLQGASFGTGMDYKVTTNMMSFLMSHQNLTIVSALDGIIHFNLVSGGITFTGVYMPYSNISNLLNANTTLNLSGDYSVAMQPNGIRQLMYQFRDTSSIGFFTIANQNMSNIRNAVRIGHFLLVRFDDGAIREFAIMRQRYAIHNPFATPRENATAVVEGTMAARQDTKTANITIN